LIVAYGAGVSSSDSPEGIGPYIPYLFYFQTSQKNDFDKELDKLIFNGPLNNNLKLCSMWEGIPA
jgi:hypothetical protein